MQSHRQTVMISITIFNDLITCNGSGARLALLLFALVIVEGSSGLELGFPRCCHNNSTRTNLDMSGDEFSF